ncbi:unnamed protein product [Prunus armeniaca]|uniref:Uncharacterized protein n=1 Tax=Prunus armeniaca TaxID=36596 RepID=A0A6J5U8H3_PRUAR|nr:unnamed protein product [Prunus armeniaca]
MPAISSEIWKKYGEPQLVDTDLYFISKLKKLTPKRVDRRVGNGGTWSETESSKLVEKVSGNPNPNPIGRKRVSLRGPHRVATR